jgi:N-acetylmuramoyl-L-alanine amidase
MRPITTIIIHCSATPPDMDVGVKEIDQWHRQRGFNKIGYHFVIRRNGKTETGRTLNEVGAHAKGHNAKSIGICLVGGCRREGGKLLAENNFTPEQFTELESLLNELLASYPGVKIIGHRDVERGKECPSFSVRDWLAKRLSILKEFT